MGVRIIALHDCAHSCGRYSTCTTLWGVPNVEDWKILIHREHVLDTRWTSSVRVVKLCIHIHILQSPISLHFYQKCDPAKHDSIVFKDKTRRIPFMSYQTPTRHQKFRNITIFSSHVGYTSEYLVSQLYLNANIWVKEIVVDWIYRSMEFPIGKTWKDEVSFGQFKKQVKWDLESTSSKESK